MKTIIVLILSLLCAGTSFAADAARVVGDLKVGGLHFSKDGSTMDSSNDLLKNSGGWASATLYSAGSVVQSQGVSYVAITANQNSLPPNANWTELAAKGTQGVQGIKGDKGDTGTPACNNTKWVVTDEAMAWQYGQQVDARNRKYFYDTSGKLIGSIYQRSNASRLLSCSTYDINNNPISCKYFLSGYKVVNYTYTYTYDTNNKIISKEELAKDALGNFEWSTIYNYDSNGNLITEIAKEDMANPDLITDTTTYSITYDSNGKAVQAVGAHTDPNYTSHVVLYQYSKLCL